MEERKPKFLNVGDAKRWLRKCLIKKRQSISLSQRKKKSERIVKALLRSTFYKRAHVIATFIGFGSEVVTGGFIERAWKDGKDVLVPMTSDGFHRPFFVLFRKGDRLTKTKYGPMELAHKRKPFAFSQIDLVLVPGLGFDRSGYRLGYGGGVYDRILARTLKAQHVGLFFSDQTIVAAPRDKFDHPLSAVITDQSLIAFLVR